MGHLLRPSHAVLALLTTGICSQETAPTAVPTAAELKSEKGAFRRKHSAALRQKDSTAQRQLGHQLSRAAADATAGSAKRYVYLDEATSALARSGDPIAVHRAIDHFRAEFAIHTGARGATAINSLAAQKLPPHLRTASADLAMRLLGHAVYELDQKSAKALLRDTKKLLAPLGLGGLDAKLAALKKISDAAFKLNTRAKRARAKLTKTPDHPFSLRAIEKATLLAAGPLQDARSAELLWTAAEAAKDPFVQARLFAHAGTISKPHLSRLGDRVWNNTIAWRNNFAQQGPLDPALSEIARHVADMSLSHATGWHQQVPKGPAVTFVPGRNYTWILETNLGEIRAALYPESAPQHVANILYLSACGYYDGLEFHRVITAFMAQGGCGLGNGTGNPNYWLDTVEDLNRTFAEPGTLAMANQDKPMTESGQFFITFVPCPNLQGKHTIFGQVTSGMDVVEKMAELATPGGSPTGEIRIIRTSARSR